jgi:hypothetical protein
MTLSHDDLVRRQPLVGDALHAAGLTDRDWRHVMPMETGHFAHFALDPGSGRWKMEIHHNGDPSNTLIESDLGDDDSRVPERAMAELRHRDVVRAMGEQMQRAYANGTPGGITDEEGRQPPYPSVASHAFSHY